MQIYRVVILHFVLKTPDKETLVIPQHQKDRVTIYVLETVRP